MIIISRAVAGQTFNSTSKRSKHSQQLQHINWSDKCVCKKTAKKAHFQTVRYKKIQWKPKKYMARIKDCSYKCPPAPSHSYSDRISPELEMFRGARSLEIGANQLNLKTFLVLKVTFENVLLSRGVVLNINKKRYGPHLKF